MTYSSAERKIKICLPTILYPVKLSFKNVGEVKVFSDKQKFRDYIVSTAEFKIYFKNFFRQKKDNAR